MKLLSNEPISSEQEDIFGFDPYVEMLGDAIKNIETLPFTMGIYGENGMGKTSLMRLLCNWLIKDGYKTIWFNPWGYKDQKELHRALIRAILLKIYMVTTKKTEKQVVWRLLKDLGWPTFDNDLISVSGGYTAFNKDIDMKMPKNTLIQSFLEPTYKSKFEDEFSKVIHDYIGKHGKFVIFIDALDDGSPENTIKVLEALKSYVDKDHSVFIFGMDQSILNQDNKFKLRNQREITVSKYIKNTIQFPFIIPEIQFKKLQDCFQPYLKSIEYSTQIWLLLRHGLLNNPRKVKKFVNNFSLLKAVYMEPEISKQYGLKQPEVEELVPDNKSYEDVLFYTAKVLVIQMSYPAFYSYLATTPSSWKKYEKALNAKRRIKKDELLQNGTDDKAPTKEDILNNDPKLAEQWWNRRLRIFMKHTSGDDFPKTPSVSVIKRLVKFIDTITKSVAVEVKV